MPKPPVPRGTSRRHAVVDEPGTAWQAEADRRWKAAVRKRRPEDFVAPPLPDFRAVAPAHVTRPDVFGRFLVDRDRNVLHDVGAASPACAINEIANGTYIHFAHELEAHVGLDVVDCSHCFGEA